MLSEDRFLALEDTLGCVAMFAIILSQTGSQSGYCTVVETNRVVDNLGRKPLIHSLPYRPWICREIQLQCFLPPSQILLQDICDADGGSTLGEVSCCCKTDAASSTCDCDDFTSLPLPSACF